MEKVRPWCGQPSDRGRLKNRTEHGRDTKSRQWPKITVHGENHGNHGDREFVIFLPPYLWLELELCRGREGRGTTNDHGGDLRGADPGEGGQM